MFISLVTTREARVEVPVAARREDRDDRSIGSRNVSTIA